MLCRDNTVIIGTDHIRKPEQGDMGKERRANQAKAEKFGRAWLKYSERDARKRPTVSLRPHVFRANS